MPRVRGVINSIRVPGDIDVEDQRALQPIIGASIYATDIPIGKVEKVIINPDTRLVMAILANAILPGPDAMGSNWLRNKRHSSERRVVIPIQTVRHLTPTSVSLKEKDAVVARFNDFDPGLYFSAPEVWKTPYLYKRADILLPKHTETA